MDSWIVVVDADRASLAQIDTCRKNKDVGFQGFIDCDHPDNKDAEICSSVDYFPAFCNTKHNSCVYGLRPTRTELLSLTDIPEPQTTPLAPPQSKPPR